MNLPEKGFYYHFKHDPEEPVGNYTYEVLGVAKHTETEGLEVVYLPLYMSEWRKPATYNVRPLEMFVDEVTRDGKTFPRFTKITDPVVIAELEVLKKQLY